MINKKFRFIAAFITLLTLSAHATQETPSSTQTKTTQQNGGTYQDEVEIIKFDEYTGRDSFAIPFDENALEKNPVNDSSKTK